jgi:hypothetical protein
VRQGAYDSPGELRAQLVDREPVPGQDGAELGAGQLDRLGKAQAERVQRLLDAQDEVPSRALGGRQYSDGEDGGVGGGEPVRRAAHGPGLQQALLLGDRPVHQLGRHVAHPGVQGLQR